MKWKTSSCWMATHQAFKKLRPLKVSAQRLPQSSTAHLKVQVLRFAVMTSASKTSKLFSPKTSVLKPCPDGTTQFSRTTLAKAQAGVFSLDVTSLANLLLLPPFLAWSTLKSSISSSSESKSGKKKAQRRNLLRVQLHQSTSRTKFYRSSKMIEAKTTSTLTCLTPLSTSRLTTRSSLRLVSQSSLTLCKVSLVCPASSFTARVIKRLANKEWRKSLKLKNSMKSSCLNWLSLAIAPTGLTMRSKSTTTKTGTRWDSWAWTPTIASSRALIFSSNTLARQSSLWTTHASLT